MGVKATLLLSCSQATRRGSRLCETNDYVKDVSYMASEALGKTVSQYFVDYCILTSSAQYPNFLELGLCLIPPKVLAVNLGLFHLSGIPSLTLSDSVCETRML